MHALSEMVRNGKVDMALVYQTGDPDLEYWLVLDNPVYLQAPPSFVVEQDNWAPDIDNPPIPPQALMGQPFILLKRGGACVRLRNGFSPNSRLYREM